MRIITLAVLSVAVLSGTAQTVTTVQNGYWDQPSTWDCNCVPDNTPNLVIMHSVEITSDLSIAQPQVQITSSGELSMMFPAAIGLNTVLINEGHILLAGSILIGGLFNNAAVAEFIGLVESEATIVTDEGSLIQVEGDFINLYLLQGAGAVCVVDSTVNFGIISGTVDFCDWSPMVTEPPFIDYNMGTVENTVTFCQNSPCATGVREASRPSPVLIPSIASDLTLLSGIPADASVRVVDGTGKTVLPAFRPGNDREELGLSGLAVGVHRVVVSSPAGQRALPLVIVR